MKYSLFLFDADDTLFDFASSERESFKKALEHHGIIDGQDRIYETYRVESAILWRLLEQGKISKEFLAIERFRKSLDVHAIEVSAMKISSTYLEILPELVYLNDFAHEICEYLSTKGEVAIITNGIDRVQRRRLEKSSLKEFISFTVVSEECGFFKPDRRFLEYAVAKASRKSTKDILVIGDRIETDIRGAIEYGIAACWYNPDDKPAPDDVGMDYQISHLSELKSIALARP